MPVSKQQKLENLIANLIHNADAKIEKQVMDEIWQQTYITKIEVGSDPQIYSI
jgi:bifunctional DNase/RNase